MEFFSRDAGQARRAWLNALADGAVQFVPPELRPWLGIANELNPVVSIERAGTNALAVADPNVRGWDKVAAIGNTASNMANALAPVVLGSSGAVPAANAVEEALMGFSAANPLAFAARDFATDEFGGVTLYHGSPKAGLRELLPSPEGTGALGPGVYGSPFRRTAEMYTRDGGDVYQFEAPDDMFLGAGNRWDDIPSNVSSYQVWRDQVARLAEANPDQAEMIRAAGEKMLYDGYPFFRELAYRLGSKEAAQELYKRAGFKGLTAMVDGPEAVLFDAVSLAPSNPSTLGFRAYHGSPHDFDRFSLDKIGTGEGAQAYGHGLYFADKEEVAKGYRANNSASAKMQYGGRPINDEVRQSVAWEIDYYGYDKAKVLEEWKTRYKPTFWEGTLGRKMLRELDRMDPAKIRAGNMYEVQINADPNDFLDWDKPLSEQSAKVQDVLRSFGAKPDDVGAGAYSRAGVRKFAVMGPDGRFGPGGATREESLAMVGGDATKVREILDPSAPNRSAGLLQEGIPGIKYLDAGSRGAGDGSRNYVVFDDKLIEIIRKYGWAAAAPIFAASGLTVEEAQAQYEGQM